MTSKTRIDNCGRVSSHAMLRGKTRADFTNDLREGPHVTAANRAAKLAQEPSS